MTQQTSYWIPNGTVRTEIRVINSRFITTVGPASTVEEARAFIANIRAEMPDATHHVYAYVIGHGATTTLGMSDDGEPSGTSGRPTLAVLRGSGLGDVVLVTTRYFGGTLLGTGGLVHAYGDAAKAALAELPRQEKIPRTTLLIVVPYAAYEPIRRLIAAYEGVIQSEDFAADVTIQVLLPTVQAAGLTAEIIETTAGQGQVIEDDS
jgi:uncharacterized YigZ family protein